jgi:hypothetical protein
VVPRSIPITLAHILNVLVSFSERSAS